MNDCKLSVCIPTYNYGRFLAETIESVLAQSYADFELIIVDDNSTDNTVSVVEPYAQKDPRIRFSVNPRNLGMVQNWNRCLELARGKYVKFVFGDDLLASVDTLGRMVEILEGDSSVSLVCSARNVIDDKSAVTKVKSLFCKSGVFPGTGVINHCLQQQCNLIGEPSVVMFRKAQAERGFLTDYHQIVDLEMWFHLLEQGDFAYIKEPLCSFRVHQSQQTQVNKKSGADLDDVFLMVQHYLHKDYITLSPLMKHYLLYDHVHGIWKMQRNGTVSRELVLDRINRNYSMPRFRFLYPFYKLFKPCLKLYRKLPGLRPGELSLR